MDNIACRMPPPIRLFFCFFLLNCPATLPAQHVQDLLRPVNSAYDEKSPLLSPDGQTLYFTVGNHPGNINGMADPGDIWFSRKDGTQWSPPVHAGRLLNDKGYNAVAGFSPDGAQLFLNGHYGARGEMARTQGIAMSTRTEGAWSRPQNIQIPYFMNRSGILYGSMSADNSAFVFSAESYGSYGVEDIYVSLRRGDKWTEPKNLGRVINTQFQELSPSLSHDAKTLYFSSNGRKGSGSFDVYAATRLDDSWTNWSAPENMGPAINSEGRELFFRSYPTLGFALYTTTKSSDGYGDVRMYVPQEPLPDHDTVVYASVPPPDTEASALQENVIRETSADETAVDVAAPVIGVKVYGRISDATTGAPVAATISFEGAGAPPDVITSGEEGYALTVAPGAYNIRIAANGYVSSLEKLDANGLDMRNVEMNFSLQPVEVGTTVNLRNVLFAQARADILPESYPELDLVVNFLRENPKVRIELMGHTDGRGVPADNVRLSQQRVDRVKEYLVSKGISSRRISGKGLGGSKPIASNDTEETRRMNRRVEFVIKKL